MARWLSGGVEDGERGSIAPAIPIIAMVLLLLGGLVIDASRQLNERGEAVAFAEEAARAGAQGVDLKKDKLGLDAPMARQRVADYCRTVLARGSVSSCTLIGIETVSGNDPRPLVVHTKVTMRIPATLLGIVGVQHLSATGEGRARPYEGLDRSDAH
ncbi:pilus assembly protein TadG-related protein [Luteipulveratus mongoliensis]|uniref:Putative Flp pilus-assembly TadG-like N-terminal domain-containing protein n=1 Tax=Luteipulveratus mongoliensis TaxID=571913 RepID=A0A0K1JMX0_9MICO|nr:pilus assembly protein TadG-related protein [Luteipulveratus mongoliensis]AKU18064.1 hypothetical protein VV02_23020 [Luteipulveratus mongoliensis]